MIDFNRPIYLKKGLDYINDAVANNHRINGDGPYTEKCKEWFEKHLNTKVLLTTSCTHAIEMAAILSDVQYGDEIIMPSFTFVSTADAFVLRGARIKFVDIRKDTMNIDENILEQAINSKTKAIVPMHYAGVGCEMDTIMDIAHRHGLFVIEDAAQGMMATYKGRPLGTIGDFGSYSFHETKNYTMGEGGLCLINNSEFIKRAEIIREKGTNRAQFFRGEIDKYSWVDIGSSYLPSDINAAYLLSQLDIAEKINDKRSLLWNRYYSNLIDLKDKELIELPYIPKECKHNSHIFYIKVRDIEERTKLIAYLYKKGVHAVFHYVPLHSSLAGVKYGDFVGTDNNTTRESERLVRLPLFYDLEEEKVDYICEIVKEYYI